MGDFNLPNIDWGNHAIKPNSGYSTIAANKLLTIMEEHGLTQHVRIPTHTQGNASNILDLVLTNRPDLFKKLSVVDGVADHNTIVIDINISPKRKCRHKRKIFLRNKADNASILKHLDNFTHEYSVLNENITVNDRWNIVTSKVTDIINTCVPHFFTSSRHNLPWFTKNLKKLCKRKQRLYNLSLSRSISSSGRRCPDVTAKLFPVLCHSACRCHRTERIRDVFLPSLSWLSSASFPGYHSLHYCLL